MSQLSGKRVMPDGAEAHTCMVRFRCVKCLDVVVLDAFLGEPRHEHTNRNDKKTLHRMEPLTVVRVGQHPFGMRGYR